MTNCFNNPCECDVLPKGTYYIGDPCYAIGEPDVHWRRLCDSIYKGKNNTSARWNKKKIQNASIEQKSLENYGLQVSKHTENKKMNSINKKFHDIAIYGTAYGDGRYEDVESYSGEYYVDAGIIGAIPVQVIPKNKRTRLNGEWTVAGGHFFTFNDEVHCSTDGRYLSFGNSKKHIKIDTNPGEDDDNTCGECGRGE